MVTRIFNRLFTSFYRKLFGEAATADSLVFLKNLQYVLIGGVIAAVLSIVFQAFAGRLLGPVQYGQYVLMNSLTVFIGIPMLFGIDGALLKYNSEDVPRATHQHIVSTGLITFLGFSLVSAALYAVFSVPLSQLFSVSQGFFFATVVLAFSLFLFTLSAILLQSFHNIKGVAIIKVVQRVLVLVFFFGMVYGLSIRSYLSGVLPLVIACAVIFVCTIGYLRKYIVLRYNYQWAETLLRYGSYGVISGLAGAISANFDKIVINKVMTSADIGIYGAYNSAFVIPIFFLFGVFNSVFYPTVARRINKMGIFKKVNKTIPILFTVVLAGVVAVGFIILSLYGKEYPVDMVLGVLFAIVAVLMCLAGAYGAMMGSVGRRGAKVTTIAGIILTAVNIVLNLVLIPLIGIAGAAVSLIVAYAVNILVVSHKRIYYEGNHGDT